MTLATFPSEARVRPAHPTYTRAQALPKLLRQRIVPLDGAMGTMLQQRKLDEAALRGRRFADHPTPLKGNNELLNLTRPQVVSEIHEAYLAAGSDTVETNTFGATAIPQADYGLAHLAREMNVQAAALARLACDRHSTPGHPRFVAGAIGPTPRTASISPDVNDRSARNVSFDELRAAYREQVEGLVEGSADILSVGTIFDTLNAKAAAFAIEEAFDASGEHLPVILSGTVNDASGRAQRPDRLGVLAQRAPRAAAGGGPELRHGRGADAALPGRAGARGRRHLHQLLPQRRLAEPDERDWLRRDARGHVAAAGRVCARWAVQPRSGS